MMRLLPRIPTESPEALLAGGIPLRLAQVLWARGVRTMEEAEAFLSPSLNDLHDPFLLMGMDRAVERVRAAIESGERMIIYGDYDVDGVCATALLLETLQAHGANVGYYIPSRHREGYGLNQEAVASLAREAKLLITVDCGITSVEEAALCKSLGVALIITDHHEPPANQPEAFAIINPLLGGYPFRRLCGAGVAFKLAQALFGFEAVRGLMELVALATVADLVPLLGENRILVHFGLKQIQATKRTGLRALIHASGLDGKEITSGHLGFQLGPRINAGGRLHEASRSVEMLITHDEAVAARVAAALQAENTERKRLEEDLVAQAVQQVEVSVDFLREKVLIIVGQDWNTGVVGLVASRLVERFAWPAVVLSESGGICTGSARSIPGINIHAALTQCADLFLRFGGHAQAAGMTLASENVPELRARLNEAVAAVAERDAYVPSAVYDVPCVLAEINIPFIEQLERLAPTGYGNPSPVFLLTGATVLEARNVGSNGKHLRLRLGQNNTAMNAIAFGQGEKRATLPEQVDVLFSPDINEYLGKRSAQCNVSLLLAHQPLRAFRERCLAQADAFDRKLLRRDHTRLKTTDLQTLKALAAQALDTCQGALLVTNTLSGTLYWLDFIEKAGLGDRLSYGFSIPEDIRKYNVLCAMPEPGALDGYQDALTLDDAWVPGELSAIVPKDEELRKLYRILREGEGRFLSEAAIAEAAGLRAAAVTLGLCVFEELKLITYRASPFWAMLLPPQKCNLADSAVLTRARNRFCQEVIT